MARPDPYLEFIRMGIGRQSSYLGPCRSRLKPDGRVLAGSRHIGRHRKIKGWAVFRDTGTVHRASGWMDRCRPTPACGDCRGLIHVLGREIRIV